MNTMHRIALGTIGLLAPLVVLVLAAPADAATHCRSTVQPHSELIFNGQTYERVTIRCQGHIVDRVWVLSSTL